MEQLARAAGEQGGIVAVLGGDGSVNLVVNGLAGTTGTLAVLPAGTGDDFAKAIGVGKLEAATRLLADPKTVDVDLIGVTAGVEQRRFINVAGAGFDSEVSDVAAAMRRRLGSRAHYALATVKTLPRFVPARFHLELDGSPIDVDAMLVVVGNSYAYGGGMKVLPQASIVDGALDICIVTAMSKTAFLRAFPKVYVGKHATHPNVMMLRGRRPEDRGEPPGIGVRRRGAGRLAPRGLRGAAEGPAGRGRPEREGDPMTDGVLLIHAFPLDARMWEPQLAAFGGLAVVAPHLPGFGGSQAAGDVMTMSAGPARCVEALDAAGVDRAVVCGLSMGGYVAFELWRTSARAVRRPGPGEHPGRGGQREGAAGRRTLAARLVAEGSDFLVESPPPLLSEHASDDSGDGSGS